MSSAAANVLAKGPGASLTERANMATMARMRYWPSYMDHGWVRSERRVSAGEKEVSSEAMDDVGDWRLRMRDFVALHFLRTRWGMNAGRAESPGTVARENFWALSSRKAR